MWTKAKAVLDWVAVFLVVFITVAMSTFLVDPSQLESADLWILLGRSAIIGGSITVFYASVTYLRRSGSTVPDDIREKLPQDPPTTGDTP